MQIYKKTISNLILRKIWNIVWVLFFRFSPIFFHGWRLIILRIFGAKIIGKKIHVYPTCKIWAPWNLEMEENSCLGSYVDCYSYDKISLGKNVTVSQYSYLCSASHDYNKKSMPLITAPITIEENSWVSASVFVGPGVTIKKYSVILAGSIVVKDTEEFSVNGGNPSKFIKKRIISDI